MDCGTFHRKPRATRLEQGEVPLPLYARTRNERDARSRSGNICLNYAVILPATENKC